MVGFHVEFSQSMYSSKCPYSIAISCTRVTGPSVYWRSSWARALSEKEEAARPIDKIIVLIIFVSPVVIYFYSANTRINLICPECCDMFMRNRKLHQFIIITIIVPLEHDTVIRRENTLVDALPREFAHPRSRSAITTADPSADGPNMPTLPWDCGTFW